MGYIFNVLKCFFSPFPDSPVIKFEVEVDEVWFEFWDIFKVNSNCCITLVRGDEGVDLLFPLPFFFSLIEASIGFVIIFKGC